ncbi:hypothetical protein QBC33DRAFT_517838 [Phialemonium atrogriseum]|uniref:Uncharacterized protein n=1 Tax=Phialemonium atrogriseum TaxID=1093897 RepID=A0AAJ0BTX3_9PEZI|nr:uncharacterized protein QBC33DRAFT_517838 [Phialemonium atrogriseum]KAK1764215.1 hypothetical protein QBC33DRAFT_517838 [Phialemonium atrogriseum]
MEALFVKASGRNLYRRATVPEFQSHFNDADGGKDQPAHWYEAQLVHYGLPPSRVKGTAKMRLYDSVKKGGLAVPTNLRSMEADLKKQWKKQDRAPATPLAPPTCGRQEEREAGSAEDDGSQHFQGSAEAFSRQSQLCCTPRPQQPIASTIRDRQETKDTRIRGGNNGESR